MKISSLFSLRLTAAALAAVVLAGGCSSGTGDTGGKTPTDSITGNGTQGFKVGGQTFMMPSPVQIADMIKKSGANYDKTMLSGTQNVSNYTDQMKQALNLGVYGADLGYVTMYDQTNDALGYFTAVQKLGDQLKITSAFDKKLIDRFNSNNGKKDSIIPLVMEAFRKSDDFLKGSDRQQQAGLILCGGWIESLHFALSVYKQKPSEEIKTRIGEQKNTVNGLLALVQKIGRVSDTSSAYRPEYEPLIQKLADLSTSYSSVTMDYVFAEPKTDAANHLTEINGTTTVGGLDEAKLTELAEKVKAIRDLITN